MTEAVPDREPNESFAQYANRLNEWRPAPLQQQPGEPIQSFIDRQARYSPVNGFKLRRRTETAEQHAARLQRLEAAEREARVAAEQEAAKRRAREERSRLVQAGQAKFVAELTGLLVTHLRRELDRHDSPLAGWLDVVFGPGDTLPADQMQWPTAVIIQAGGTWRPPTTGYGDLAELVVLTRGTDPEALKRLWREDGPMVAALRSATVFSYDAGRSRQTGSRSCARVVEDLSGRPDAGGGRRLYVAGGFYEVQHVVTVEGRGRAEVPPPLTAPRPVPVERFVLDNGTVVAPGKVVYGPAPRG